MARPHPVVDVATELADQFPRCIDQAHILDFKPLDQLAAVAAVKRVDVVTITVTFSAFHLLLVRHFDGLVPLGNLHRVGQRGGDLAGDVTNFLGDKHRMSGEP